MQQRGGRQVARKECQWRVEGVTARGSPGRHWEERRREERCLPGLELSKCGTCFVRLYQN